MPDALFRVLQALVAGSAFAVSYWRWVRPHQAEIAPQGVGLLLLLVLTLVGGLIGGVFWWVNEPGSFAWPLPALAARMLAAAGWAYAAAALLTLQRPTPGRLRLMLVLLVVYLAPLVASILVFHLGRFDPSATITYAFFLVVAGMFPSAIWWLLRQPTVLAAADRELTPPIPLTRAWFVAAAIGLGLWGLALFVTDAGPSSLVWVWPGDPLSSQLIGVMLLSVAAGAVMSLRSIDLARLTLVFMLVYGLGVVAGTVSLALARAPIRLAYLVVFGAIGAGSAALLAAERGNFADAARPRTV